MEVFFSIFHGKKKVSQNIKLLKSYVRKNIDSCVFIYLMEWRDTPVCDLKCKGFLASHI